MHKVLHVPSLPPIPSLHSLAFVLIPNSKSTHGWSSSFVPFKCLLPKLSFYTIFISLVQLLSQSLLLNCIKLNPFSSHKVEYISITQALYTCLFAIHVNIPPPLLTSFHIQGNYTHALNTTNK